MTESARKLKCDVHVASMCHWLYFKKDLWYWQNLLRNTRANVARLTKMVREQGIELVYTNTSTLFEAAFAARRAGVPHLWHVHEVLKPSNRMSQLVPICWMQQFIKSYSSLVVFESQSARSVFEKHTPLKNGKVVYNSVRFTAEGTGVTDEEARARFGLLPSQKVICFVGQFIDRKNPLLLIDAISRLRDSDNVVCLFVGEGPLADAMGRAIDRFGIGGKCRIVPFQQDIRPLISAVEVLVLPSRQESFGLVLAEAGMFGKPVIACRSEGPNEIVVEGETGFLVPQDDADALACALDKLLADAALRCRLGTNGCQRILELFHPEQNTRRLEALMLGLVNRNVLHGAQTECLSDGSAEPEGFTPVLSQSQCYGKS